MTCIGQITDVASVCDFCYRNFRAAAVVDSFRGAEVTLSHSGSAELSTHPARMYGKIFEQIYDSSIAEDWQVRIVFQDMIILADENGVVDRTPEALSRRTNVPIDVVTRAIDQLQKPDPTSRSPDENGARIKLLDEHRSWGWEIINFEYYRNLSSAYQKRERTRLRTRKWRDKSNKRDKASQGVTERQRAASASAYVQKEGVQGKGDGIDVEIYEAYPRKVAKPAALKAIRAAVIKHGGDHVLQRTKEYAQARVGQDPQFTPHPSTFFNQERFNDDPSTWRQNGKAANCQSILSQQLDQSERQTALLCAQIAERREREKRENEELNNRKQL